VASAGERQPADHRLDDDLREREGEKPAYRTGEHASGNESLVHTYDRQRLENGAGNDMAALATVVVARMCLCRGHSHSLSRRLGRWIVPWLLTR
jgi:hypothetical protein